MCCLFGSEPFSELLLVYCRIHTMHIQHYELFPIHTALNMCHYIIHMQGYKEELHGKRWFDYYWHPENNWARCKTATKCWVSPMFSKLLTSPLKDVFPKFLKNMVIQIIRQYILMKRIPIIYFRSDIVSSHTYLPFGCSCGGPSNKEIFCINTIFNQCV